MRLGTKRKTFSSILILAPPQTGYMVTHVVVLYEKRWVSIVLINTSGELTQDQQHYQNQL